LVSITNFVVEGLYWKCLVCIWTGIPDLVYPEYWAMAMLMGLVKIVAPPAAEKRQAYRCRKDFTAINVQFTLLV